jgi:heme-degrading monooxygenase HmoA
MMTIIARVSLRDGAGSEWDTVMSERLDTAKHRHGWIEGRLCRPVDAADERIIVGTWESRGAWASWHDDPSFKETRERLEGLQTAPTEFRWYEVVVAEGAERSVATGQEQQPQALPTGRYEVPTDEQP